MHRITRPVLALLATAALSLTVLPGDAAGQTPEPEPEPEPVAEPVVEPPPEPAEPAVDVTVEGAVADMVKLGEWIDAYSRAKWYEGVAAADAARAEAAARARPSGGGYHPGTTSGECSGFAIPDYIIQRESGGNPSAYNPSGAYGCAQTLLSHYSRGQCQGLDPYNIDGQRECVNRLSNGGTNLRPWAATR